MVPNHSYHCYLSEIISFFVSLLVRAVREEGDDCVVVVRLMAVFRLMVLDGL